MNVVNNWMKIMCIFFGRAGKRDLMEERTTNSIKELNVMAIDRLTQYGPKIFMKWKFTKQRRKREDENKKKNR